MNKTAKLATFTSRKREGDVATISTRTGYSESHIRNIITGHRGINEQIANEMYKLCSRRTKNSLLTH